MIESEQSQPLNESSGINGNNAINETNETNDNSVIGVVISLAVSVTYIGISIGGLQNEGVA